MALARWLAILGVVCACDAASAQEVLVLRPDAFTLPAAAPLRVSMNAPGQADPILWAERPLEWLYIRGEGTQENLHDVAPTIDERGRAALPAPPPDAVAIGADLRSRTTTVDAPRLRQFAIARCDTPLPEGGPDRIRLMQRTSCKALLRIGEAPASSYAAINKGGQAAEIVPGMDPTRIRAGSDLALLTTIGGEGAPCRVLATHVPTGATAEVRTNEKGRGHLRVSAAGEWRLEFHRLAPSEAADADWVLTSATLCFEVPDFKAPSPEARP